MRLRGVVDWAGLIDDAEVRAVPSAGALPSWGGRERVSDTLSVAGPASVPRSLGCPHERHRSGWAAADECAIATPDEKAPPAGADGSEVSLKGYCLSAPSLCRLFAMCDRRVPRPELSMC